MVLEEQEKLEQSSEGRSSRGESTALKEANAGKADMIDEQKAKTERLKAGESSGVSGIIGKPTFFDSSEDEVEDSAKTAAKNSVAVLDGALPEAKGDNASGNNGDKTAAGNNGDKSASGDRGDTKSGDTDSGDMGRAGDRTKDHGNVQTKPEIEKNEDGSIKSYKLPDGTRYDFEYNEKGDATKVRVVPEEGQPMVFEKGKNGWRDVNDPNKGLEYVSVDKETKAVTIRSSDDEVTIDANGSSKEKNWKTGKPNYEVDADGNAKRYDPNSGEETSTKAGSHISEVKNSNGDPQGYEVRDDQGHMTKVQLNADGKATVTKGDKKEEYEKAEKADNGDLKLTAKDKSTTEIKTDGTTIHRDASGKILDITNSDGEKTQFKHAGNKVSEVTVMDANGKVVEKSTKGIELDEKTGTYTVEKDKGQKVERAADGTERTLDKDGKVVETEQDKLLAKFKNYTPEQIHQLKQDLADIDKMPEDQRKKVYESLNKIARNDEHPEAAVHLTGQQARELVASTAHNIAHPESIKQGDKMTCAVANAEQTMAKEHPEVYADMVAKLATDGKYTTPGGKTIEAQHDGDKLGPKTDYYGQRSYASELFQNGAAQLGMKEGDTYKSYPPDDPGLKPRPAGVNPSGDTGERIVHADGTTSKFKGFDSKEQADIMNQLAPGDKYKATEPIATPADLENAVKKNGGTPLNVGIHLGPESSFSGMSGNSGAAGSGYHAVNISRIETGPDGKKYVYYENPSGGTDHSYPNGTGVPIDDFVKAMQGGDTKMRAITKDK